MGKERKKWIFGEFLIHLVLTSDFLHITAFSYRWKTGETEKCKNSWRQSVNRLPLLPIYIV